MDTVEPLLMATPDEWPPSLYIMITHLGPHCIEIVLIKPLICGCDPSIVAEIYGANGGHCRWGSFVVITMSTIIVLGPAQLATIVRARGVITTVANCAGPSPLL